MSVKTGGAAAAGGFDFQNRVAAWFGVRILADAAAAPPWGLPAGTTFEWLRCETEQPIDDLLVGTSDGSLIFCQVKRTVALSPGADSELFGVIKQFVEQYQASQRYQAGSRPWDRPLDPGRDQMVLVCGPTSSGPVKRDLSSVLRRFRTLRNDQPIEDAATNQEEQNAISVFLNHARTCWQNAFGTPAVGLNLRQLLQLVRVEELDLESGGVDEGATRELLRSSVLVDPANDEVVWRSLIATAAELCARKSGVDRSALQDGLASANLAVLPATSYRADIKRLAAHSKTTLALLRHLSELYLAKSQIKIGRESTIALQAAAETSSLVVVGQPGAGKSGALHDLVQAALKDSRDVVFLAVDHVEATSLGSLRQELGLEHDFHAVLQNWTGSSPAFLVIDALDAARAEPAAQTLRDLIRIASDLPRWRVVVSIRKFDLRYGTEVRTLFRGEPPTQFTDPEFSGVRHIEIPVLADEELTQIERHSAHLYSLILNAPKALREVLFNVRIFAELLDSGVDPRELTAVRTQLELLDRYWAYRVVDSGAEGDAREAALRRVAEQMLRSRNLHLERSWVGDASAIVPLRSLLSRQVLIEWQRGPDLPPERNVIAFAHHVMFDYAVARTLFRVPTDALLARLAADRELVIVARPSLLLHFHYMWTTSGVARSDFWELALGTASSEQLPAIAKLIGPAAAAELATTPADIEVLMSSLEAPSAVQREAAATALRHMIGALLVAGARPAVGPNAGPWAIAAERVSRLARGPLTYDLRLLLTMLCEHADSFTEGELEACGIAARRLLEVAWTIPARDSWLVIHALQCVCRTYRSDLDASGRLLRRALEPRHMQQFAFEELPWIAREADHVLERDPAFVEDLYRAAFTFNDESGDKTALGASRILALTSTRRQDYRHALYELGRFYPKFLRRDHIAATRALIGALETYVKEREGRGGSSPEDVASFDFDGIEARLRADHSYIWDQSSAFGHDEPLVMLTAFESQLSEHAGDADAAWRRSALEEIARRNENAVLWRAVLRVGIKHPDTLGVELLPLCRARDLLVSPETSQLVGELLAVVFCRFPVDSRKAIEEAVLECTIDLRDGELATEPRDRLLGCLPMECLVSQDALTLVRQLRESNSIPPNVPPFRFSGVTSREFGENEFLAQEGVQGDLPSHIRIRELEKPVATFARTHLNGVPTEDDVRAVLPAIRQLYDALRTASADGVHVAQQNYAWGVLTDASGSVARQDALSCDQVEFSSVRDVLLEGSEHPEPHAHESQHEQFDKSPSWGGPAARINAADGLIVLSRNASCVNGEVFEAVQRLAADPVPSVRYQIASKLNALGKTHAELMWKLAARFADEERSRGVLQGFLGGALDRLAGAEPQRVITLALRVFNRISDGPGAEEVRRLAIGIIAGLYVWRNVDDGADVLRTIAATPDSHRDEILNLLHLLREPTSYGPADFPDEPRDAIRHRAIELYGHIFAAAREQLRGLEQQHVGKSFDAWAESDRQRAQTAGAVLDAVASELFFASGAFARESGDKPSLGDAKRRRFYNEFATILDGLAELGFPSIAHNLLQTLESFIEFDAEGVFIRIAKVIAAGAKAGYHYESLAADLMVRLVERYLADYRPLLRQSDECRRRLVDILDTFVSAGWPSARRLSYRLEDIFR